jgi:hypothetical protein
MNNFDIYIILIFIVKIAFVILAVYRLYIKAKNPKDKKLLETVEFWKGRFEFMFITLMSILLIYLFYPRANRINMIDGETKLLLYLFGFVLLLTENWSSFIHESSWFKKFQKVLN